MYMCSILLSVFYKWWSQNLQLHVHVLQVMGTEFTAKCSCITSDGHRIYSYMLYMNM